MTVLTVTCPHSDLALRPKHLDQAIVGMTYTMTIRAKNAQTPIGGAAVITGALPPGLSLLTHKFDDGFQIVGTPEQPGEYHFVIATYSYGTQCTGQEGKRAYTLNVIAPVSHTEKTEG